MALTTFAEVQAFFDNFIKDHNISLAVAPPLPFWDTPYDNFVNGNVPGGSETADPNTGQPLKILIIGDGDHSNIIYALRGTTGTVWEKNTPNSAFVQMPYNGPYFTDAQIDELRDWINNK